MECKAIKQLFVGFKGKKNSSAILVSALSSQPCLLTNSFEGLKNDIENLSPGYDEVWLFGVDKGLETSVRIERVAEKDGIRRSTKLDVEDLAARFSRAGLKATVAFHTYYYFTWKQSPLKNDVPADSVMVYDLCPERYCSAATYTIDTPSGIQIVTTYTSEGEEWGGTWREYVILDDCLIMYYSFYSL